MLIITVFSVTTVYLADSNKRNKFVELLGGDIIQGKLRNSKVHSKYIALSTII